MNHVLLVAIIWCSWHQRPVTAFWSVAATSGIKCSRQIRAIRRLRPLLTEILRRNEPSVCGSWWSLTARVNERSPRPCFLWLAAFSPSGRSLIDFSGLELRLCPYWSLILGPVSSPIKSSLSRHYGPTLMNTTFLPTSQCCIPYAVRLRCFLTPFLTLFQLCSRIMLEIICLKKQRSAEINIFPLRKVYFSNLFSKLSFSLWTLWCFV